MTKQLNFYLLALLPFTFTGCLYNELTVRSQPAGASVYEIGSNRMLGVTPLTLSYDPARYNKNEYGCYFVRGLRAKWPSGAESYSDSQLRICSYDHTLDFTRPENHPGLNQDMEYGMHVETLRYQKERDEKERAAKVWDDILESEKKTVCTTIDMGDIITTECEEN